MAGEYPCGRAALRDRVLLGCLAVGRFLANEARFS
jgi:hypothetical protein